MNSLLKNLIFASGLGLLLLTTGCFDTKDDFTLNPDGSGKVVHECTFQAVNLNMGGDSDQDPGQALTNAVRELLHQAKGVDAWRDVTFKTQDDGRLYFRGTAYFKNLSKLEIPNQTMLDFDWTKAPDGTALLTLRTNKSEPSEGIGLSLSQKKAPAKKLSPGELEKQIKKERAQYQQAKPMLTGILGPMKQSVVFHLPGKVRRQSNFTNATGGDLAITFSGQKMLKVMDTLVNDDNWCREHNGTGFDNMNDKPTMDAEINQFMFGEKAPVEAVIAPGSKPLFDYATEVAAAKKKYNALKNSLAAGSGEDEEAEATAAPADGGIKSVKIVGVRWISESDRKRDLRPFNWDAGYTVSLLVEFPGAVQSVTDKSTLDVATADDGSSLLPDREWDRKVHFPKLAKDKTAGILEFKLKLPGNKVNGLKELSGQVQYRVAGGTRKVDLGFHELKAGATGTNLDARIESIEEGWNKDGSQRMSLHLGTHPDNIKSLWLVADGTKTELHQNGYGGGNNSFNFNYESKTAFPANGKLVAEVYDQIKTFEAPFKLENITLLGKSLDPGK